MDDTLQSVPHSLRQDYAGDPGLAPFTVDDVVSAGFRRRRKALAARGATGVAGVAAAALVVVGSAGLLQHAPAQPATPASGGAVPAAAQRQPGCVQAPVTCKEVVADWARRVAGSTAPVGQTSADAYEKGAVVLVQTTTRPGTPRDVHLSVVIAPTTTTGRGMVAGSGGSTETVRLAGLEGAFTRSTVQDGGNFIQTWDVAAAPGRRPAVQVVLNVANQGSSGTTSGAKRVDAPDYWTQEAVAELFQGLLGTRAAT